VQARARTYRPDRRVLRAPKTQRPEPSGDIRAIVAAVLFAIALVFDLAGIVLGPVDSFAFLAAGLPCLVLQLAGVGACFMRSWRRSRL
jgi:hypothetical protein